MSEPKSNFGWSVVWYGSSQIGARILNVLVGLLIIRSISTDEYALYASFGVIVGAAAVSTDFGIGPSLTTLLSRKPSQSRQNELIGMARKIRNVLVLISCTFFLPFYFVITPGALELSAIEVVVVSICAVLAIYAQGRVTIDKVVLASAQTLTPLSYSEPMSVLVRLLVVLLGFWLLAEHRISVPIVAWALAATAVAFWLAKNTPETKSKWEVEKARELYEMASPLVPNQVYFVVTSLIPLFALGVANNPIEIAAFWACMRLSAILDMLRPLLSSVAHPYISRATGSMYLVRSMYVLGAVTVVCAVFVASAFFAAEYWVILIGSEYYDYVYLIPLVFIISFIRVLNSAVNSAVIASGKTNFQYFTVLVGIVSQVGSFAVFPIVDAQSAAYFSISVSLCMLLSCALLLVRSSLLVIRTSHQ